MSQTIDGRTFVKAASALLHKKLDGLDMIRVTDWQAAVISDRCREILLTGPNRGGKSLTAATRFSSLVRDRHVLDVHGNRITARHEYHRGIPLLTWVIGDYEKHIGQTIYPLLFDEGAYSMVRDESTGFWRSWNPVVNPSDNDIPLSDRKPAPPLIPEREIKAISWNDRGKRVFEQVTLKNGTQIRAYASSGEVKQGDKVHAIWIDEHIVRDSDYSEFTARLIDYQGSMFWSSIARDESVAYILVEDRAEEQAKEVAKGERDETEVTTRVHRIGKDENPFVSEEAKAEFASRVMGERDYLVRVEGKRSGSVIAVYPEFSEFTHTVYYGDERDDELCKILERNNWFPPQDWTRELILDPGTQKPGVLFGAVPPPELWQESEPYLIVYGEIFIRRLDAVGIAREVNARERGNVFNRFIIDGKAAAQKPMGFSGTVGANYSEKFKAEKLECVASGSQFTPGDPNFRQRSTLLKSYLRQRKCGYPQLRIVKHRCPELVKQMRTNVRKTDRDGNPTEEAADNQIDDLRDCLEYWASRRPTYVRPPAVVHLDNDPIYRRMLELRASHAATKSGGRLNDNGVVIGRV